MPYGNMSLYAVSSNVSGSSVDVEARPLISKTKVSDRRNFILAHSELSVCFQETMPYVYNELAVNQFLI